jgi:hypothetical protein
MVERKVVMMVVQLAVELVEYLAVMSAVKLAFLMVV